MSETPTTPQAEPTEQILVPFEWAVEFLPKKPKVHAVRNSTAGVFVGADWQYEQIVDAMKQAPWIALTGEIAQGQGYGLAIADEHGFLFIETRARTDQSETTP